MKKVVNNIAAISVLSLLASPALVQAHVPAESAAAEYAQPVSASEARRIVRRFLSEQGYSKAIGPGGARLRGIELREGDWVVAVAVSGGSATDLKEYAVVVDAATGAVRQTVEQVVYVE